MRNNTYRRWILLLCIIIITGAAFLIRHSALFVIMYYIGPEDYHRDFYEVRERFLIGSVYGELSERAKTFVSPREVPHEIEWVMSGEGRQKWGSTLSALERIPQRSFYWWLFGLEFKETVQVAEKDYLPVRYILVPTIRGWRVDFAEIP